MQPRLVVTLEAFCFAAACLSPSSPRRAVTGPGCLRAPTASSFLAPNRILPRLFQRPGRLFHFHVPRRWPSGCLLGRRCRPRPSRSRLDHPGVQPTKVKTVSAPAMLDPACSAPVFLLQEPASSGNARVRRSQAGPSEPLGMRTPCLPYGGLPPILLHLAWAMKSHPWTLPFCQPKEGLPTCPTSKRH